jgi:hypothetical protein
MVNKTVSRRFTTGDHHGAITGSGKLDLKATRRRTRRSDPLASAAAVEAVLEHLRSSLPEIIPCSHKGLVSLLNSVRGLYMRQPTETGRGRPSRHPREQLLRVNSALRDLLARETVISVRSFVGQYLPILDFPKDVREARERGDVNLFESHQLARLTARRLGSTEAQARSLRKRLLEAHLLAQGSGTLLRERVKEALGEMRGPDPTETEVIAMGKADELLEADPLDASHLFFEELRMISRALREIGPEEVTEEDLAEIMPAMDQITLTLQKIASHAGLRCSVFDECGSKHVQPQPPLKYRRLIRPEVAGLDAQRQSSRVDSEPLTSICPPT